MNSVCLYNKLQGHRSCCGCKTCNLVLEKPQKVWGDGYAQHGLRLHVGRVFCAKSLKHCVFSLFSCATWTTSSLFFVWGVTSEFEDHFSERDFVSLMQSSISSSGIKVGKTGTVISMMLLKSTVTVFQENLCRYLISLWLELSLNK